MLDFLKFLVIQFFNVFGFLDSIIIFGNLSFLNLIIFIIIFSIVLSFLNVKR